MHIRYIIDFVENDWRMVYKSNLLKSSPFKDMCTLTQRR